MSHNAKTLKKTIQTVDELNILIERVQKNKQAAQDHRSKILLTEEEVSVILQISKSFLREKRCRGEAPAHYKFGSTVRYDYFELMDYIDSCQRHVN